MIEAPLTEPGLEALWEAARVAERWGDPSVTADHLFLALLRGEGTGACRLLAHFRVDPLPLVARLERYLSWADCEAQAEIRKAHARKAGEPVEQMLPRTARILDLAHAAAREHGHLLVGTEHLLYGLVREGGSLGAWLLLRAGLSPQSMSARLAVSLPEAGLPVPSLAPSAATVGAINLITGVAILGLLWGLVGLHFLLGVLGPDPPREYWPGLVRSVWAAGLALASIRPGMQLERRVWPRMMALLFVSSAGAVTLLTGSATGMMPLPSRATFFFLIYVLPLLVITAGLFRARSEFGVSRREGWRVLWREGKVYLGVSAGLELAVLAGVIRSG